MAPKTSTGKKPEPKAEAKRPREGSSESEATDDDNGRRKAEGGPATEGTAIVWGPISSGLTGQQVRALFVAAEGRWVALPRFSATRVLDLTMNNRALMLSPEVWGILAAVIAPRGTDLSPLTRDSPFKGSFTRGMLACLNSLHSGAAGGGNDKKREVGSMEEEIGKVFPDFVTLGWLFFSAVRHPEEVVQLTEAHVLRLRMIMNRWIASFADADTTKELARSRSKAAAKDLSRT